MIIGRWLKQTIELRLRASASIFAAYVIIYLDKHKFHLAADTHLSGAAGEGTGDRKFSVETSEHPTARGKAHGRKAGKGKVR